jgi:hypothetical protein
MEPGMFATLWYAGAVVFSMGVAGPDACEYVADTIEADIVAAYQDPAKAEELSSSMFPDVAEFRVTCDPERLPIDPQYLPKTE